MIDVERVASAAGVGDAIDEDVALLVVLVACTMIVSHMLRVLYLFRVVPEVLGIVRVGLALVEIAKELVKAHIIGDARLVVQPDAPFAKLSGRVSGILEHLGHRIVAGLKRVAVGSDHVLSHRGVSLVQPLHEA